MSIADLQAFLGVTADGQWGPLSEAALQAVIHPAPAMTHSGLASSFADPEDVAAFRRCKAEGKSDQECFAVGDNGKGFWGDDTTSTVPQCALRPQDIAARFGDPAKGRRARVEVAIGDRSIVCLLTDHMPHDPPDDAIIDLSPAAVAALGQHPPMLTRTTWRWA